MRQPRVMAAHPASTHRGDRAAYTAGKTPFVERVIAEHDFLAEHDPQAEEEYRWGALGELVLWVLSFLGLLTFVWVG